MHAHLSRLPASLAKRLLDRSRQILADLQVPADFTLSADSGRSNGVSLQVSVRFERGVASFSGLGERGKPAERVADEVCSNLIEFLENGASVDAHLADQMLLPAALSGKSSRFSTMKITNHLRTNVQVVETFLDVKIRIDEETRMGEVNCPSTCERD